MLKAQRLVKKVRTLKRLTKISKHVQNFLFMQVISVINALVC